MSKTKSREVASQPAPNLKRAFELVMQLMEIPGGSGDELRVANFITGKLKAAGAPATAIKFDRAHKKTPLAGNVGNLILKLPGTVKGPRRLLSAHMDTVPICIGCQPVRKGGYVRSANPKTGLGADDRAGCATLLSAALEILEGQLPHPPVTFCWFIQEEIGLYGARNVNAADLGRPQLAFNWDGGSPNKLTVGATGGYRMEIEICGLASHAGVAPEMGVSAIAIASLAIADLQRAGWHGDVRRNGQLGTSNVGIIRGGDATNVVTDHVYLKAEARSHDSKFRQRIVEEIENAFRRAVQEVRNAEGTTGEVRFKGQLDYDSFRLDPHSASVSAATNAVRAIGLEPLQAISNGGVDANWLNAHGIPSVTLGCGQVEVHTVREALDIAAFEHACQIALRLATGTESG